MAVVRIQNAIKFFLAISDIFLFVKYLVSVDTKIVFSSFHQRDPLLTNIYDHFDFFILTNLKNPFSVFSKVSNIC